MTPEEFEIHIKKYRKNFKRDWRYFLGYLTVLAISLFTFAPQLIHYEWWVSVMVGVLGLVLGFGGMFLFGQHQRKQMKSLEIICSQCGLIESYNDIEIVIGTKKCPHCGLKIIGN